jgi:hypothetical protein
MATLTIARRRKIPLTRVATCRAFLTILAIPLFAQPGQTKAPLANRCQLAGQVFGWDVVGHQFTVKTDSGDYFEFRYDDSTIFTRADATLPPEGLNIDDRVCVEAFRTNTWEIASRVRVTSRPEIEARDKRELVRWQNESVYGTVKSWDPISRRITVSVAAAPDTSVEAAEPAAFWMLPKTDNDLAGAIHGTWETLVVGDPIYVRGEWIPGTQAMRARLIVSGGFCTLSGSIESIDPLMSLVGLRDFRSGTIRSVHFDFMPIYIVGKATGPRVPDRQLYRASVGDLKEGDSVLLFGRENNQTGRIDAFVLITGFSPGGLLEPGPGQSLDWIFQAAGLGAHRP